MDCAYCGQPITANSFEQMYECSVCDQPFCCVTCMNKHFDSPEHQELEKEQLIAAGQWITE